MSTWVSWQKTKGGRMYHISKYSLLLSSFLFCGIGFILFVNPIEKIATFSWLISLGFSWFQFRVCHATTVYGLKRPCQILICSKVRSHWSLQSISCYMVTRPCRLSFRWHLEFGSCISLLWVCVSLTIFPNDLKNYPRSLLLGAYSTVYRIVSYCQSSID